MEVWLNKRATTRKSTNGSARSGLRRSSTRGSRASSPPNAATSSSNSSPTASPSPTSPANSASPGRPSRRCSPSDRYRALVEDQPRRAIDERDLSAGRVGVGAAHNRERFGRHVGNDRRDPRVGGEPADQG